jgi:hypothetical protein
MQAAHGALEFALFGGCAAGRHGRHDPTIRRACQRQFVGLAGNKKPGLAGLR